MIEVVGNGASSKATFVYSVADLGAVVGTNGILGMLSIWRGSVKQRTKGKRKISNGCWQIQKKSGSNGSVKTNRLLSLKLKHNAHLSDRLSLNHL